MKTAIIKFCSVIFSLFTLSVSAQLYWDIDGANPGAGGATPSGAWDTTTANWTTDSTGASASQAWADGNAAVFAAGTDASGSYTVTVSGTQTPTGITFEEGDVTLNGGTLAFSGGGSIQVDATQATINSALSGSGLWSKLGFGTLVLSDPSPAYTPLAPGFSLVQGTLRMGTSGAILSSAPVTLSGAAVLDLNNLSVGIGSVGGTSGSINLGSGTLTNLGVTANSTFSGVVSGSGSGIAIVKAGANNLSLNGVNTFTGKTLVTGGILFINSSSSLGTLPGLYVADQITLNGGTLQFAASAARILANRGITVGTSGGTIAISSSQTCTNEANIVGPGGLIKGNSGNLSLNSTNTFAGNFTITGGGVRFNSDIAAGTASIIVAPASSVFLRNLGAPGNVSTVTNAITVNATANFADLNSVSPETFILSGPISGAGPLLRGQQAGSSGTVVLSGDNSGWSGGLTLWRGKLALGHKNALGPTALLIRPATFTGTSDAVVLAWTPLIGANAVTTPVNIDITNAAANFSIAGTNALELSGPMNLGATTTPVITVTNTGGTIFSGGVSGGASVGLTKNGVDTLTLSGANTYSGVTTINAGTLLVNAPGSIGSGNVVVNSGGTLGGSGTINGAVTINSGGSIGAGSSAGTLSLANGLNLSAGGTNVWELAANSTSNPGTDFDQIVLTGGNLVLGGSSVLQINFTGTVNFTDPFWQANHSWKIINGSNPGSTTFPSINGTNGITAGTFAMSADTTGVFLNYTTAATPSTPRPRITSITGAGTTSVTVNYTNTSAGTNYVLQYNTNLATANWYNVTTNQALGTTASQTNNPPAGGARRYYRVYFVTP